MKLAGILAVTALSYALISANRQNARTLSKEKQDCQHDERAGQKIKRSLSDAELRLEMQSLKSQMWENRRYSRL